MLRISEFFEEPERRASPRFDVPQGKPPCQLLEIATGQRWPATIRDISIGGLSLIVEKEFATDTLLAIDLSTPTGTCLCTLRLRVVHCRPRPEGGWLMGCALASKLADNELHGYLGSNAKPPQDNAAG